MEMILRYLTGRLRYGLLCRGSIKTGSGRVNIRNDNKMSEPESDLISNKVSPPPGYIEGPHPVISGQFYRGLIIIIMIIISNPDPLFSLIILIYVSVIFLYMFFAFCWYDGMPIATFSSLPERTRRKTTYKRFVYPYPDDLHGNGNVNGHNLACSLELLNEKTLLDEKVGIYSNSMVIFVCVDYAFILLISWSIFRVNIPRRKYE